MSKSIKTMRFHFLQNSVLRINSIGALFALSICISFTSHAAEISPVELEYTVKLEGVIADVTAGKIQTKLDRAGSGYSVSTLTKAEGMAATFLGTNIQESCRFKIEQSLVVPINYAGGTIKSQNYKVSYDWADRKIDFGDESLDMPQGYLIDNCAMPFAITILKGLAPGNEAIYVVDGKTRRIRGYTVRATEQEKIRTPLGELQTTKMVLEREFRPERTFTFWLSNKDEFLPVKMQEKRKSRTTTMMIRRMDFDG